MDFTPLLWLAGSVAVVALAVEVLARDGGRLPQEEAAHVIEAWPAPYVDFHTPAWMAAFAQVSAPDQLPTFAHVIGMDMLKERLDDVAGPVLRRPPDDIGPPSRAILLWGRRGAGKVALASALAGHFGARLIHVSARFLVSQANVTQQPRIAMLVRYAQTHTPSVLLIDDLDMLTSGPRAQVALHDVLNELRRRDRRARVVVVGALTADALIPSRHIREAFEPVFHVDHPDATTRAQLVERLLVRHRMIADDHAAIVDLTAGLTRAELIHALHQACARAEVGGGSPGVLTPEHVAAVTREPDQPCHLAELALSVGLKVQVDGVLRRLADRDAHIGVLLTGDPGTGKTTLARALAASAGRHLVEVTERHTTAAALEAHIERAVARRPSVLLIDESPVLESPERHAARTGCVPGPHADRFVAAIVHAVGQPGVAVIATASRMEMIDGRLLGGGRLSHLIWVAYPDQQARLELVRQHLRSVRLRHLSPAALAGHLDGLTPAQIGMVLADAVRSAERRLLAVDPSNWPDEPVVTPRDVWRALQLVSEAA